MTEAGADALTCPWRQRALGGCVGSERGYHSAMAEPIPLAGRLSIEIEAKLHRGLADPSRLAILRQLRRGPLTAGQIASLVGLTPPRASNHLRCLLECGLVTIEPRGRYNVYQLANPAVGRLLDASTRVLADAAPLIEACLNYGPPSRRSLRPPADASPAAGQSESPVLLGSHDGWVQEQGENR